MLEAKALFNPMNMNEILQNNAKCDLHDFLDHRRWLNRDRYCEVNDSITQYYSIQTNVSSFISVRIQGKLFKFSGLNEQRT